MFNRKHLHSHLSDLIKETRLHTTSESDKPPPEGPGQYDLSRLATSLESPSEPAHIGLERARSRLADEKDPHVRLSTSRTVAARQIHAGDLRGALATLEAALAEHAKTLAPDDIAERAEDHAHVVSEFVWLALQTGDLAAARDKVTFLHRRGTLLKQAVGTKEWTQVHRYLHAERLLLAFVGDHGAARSSLAEEVNAEGGQGRSLWGGEPEELKPELADLALLPNELARSWNYLSARAAEPAVTPELLLLAARSALAHADAVTFRRPLLAQAGKLAQRAWTATVVQRRSRLHVANCHLCLAQVARQQGRFRLAEHRAKKARNLAKSIGARRIHGLAELELAKLAHARRNFKAAIQHADCAENLALDAGQSMVDVPLGQMAFAFRLPLAREARELRYREIATRPLPAVRGHTVILVHGTFASPLFGNTQWYEPGSEFCSKLDAELSSFGSQARCWSHAENKSDCFFWSGDNHWASRRVAAEELATELRSLLPHWRCHIVAHSHGGNVAFDAIRLLEQSHNGDRPAFDGSLTTLGTPFLTQAKDEAGGGLSEASWLLFVPGVPILLWYALAMPELQFSHWAWIALFVIGAAVIGAVIWSREFTSGLIKGVGAVEDLYSRASYSQYAQNVHCINSEDHDEAYKLLAIAMAKSETTVSRRGLGRILIEAWRSAQGRTVLPRLLLGLVFSALVTWLAVSALLHYGEQGSIGPGAVVVLGVVVSLVLLLPGLNKVLRIVEVVCGLLERITGTIISVLWELTWPWRFETTRRRVKQWVAGLGGTPGGTASYRLGLKASDFASYSELPDGDVAAALASRRRGAQDAVESALAFLEAPGWDEHSATSLWGRIGSPDLVHSAYFRSGECIERTALGIIVSTDRMAATYEDAAMIIIEGQVAGIPPRNAVAARMQELKDMRVKSLRSSSGSGSSKADDIR